MARGRTHPMLASAAERCFFFSRSSSSFAMRLRWLLLMFVYGCSAAGCAGCSVPTTPPPNGVQSGGETPNQPPRPYQQVAIRPPRR